MASATFRGGVHPKDGKSLSAEKEIRAIRPDGEYVFLVSQHIGAPAKPVVKPGDTVLRGQLIAEAGGFVSAPVFSSVSGLVKEIEKRRTATGDLVDAIVIDSDGEFNETAFDAVSDWHALTGAEIIERIKNAGIVGMGGAGFPTHVKLSPKAPEKIEYIIANCAECEPYLTSDYRQMMEDPDSLVLGMEMVLSVFPQAQGIFGIEDNKPAAIEALQKATAGKERMQVMPLKTKYPQGGERQLIYAVTKRSINSGMLPADAGCIVDNVATFCAIAHAVAEGKPLIDRIFTVTGEAIQEPGNFRIPIGVSFDTLLKEAGGFSEEAVKCISGGPMMGFAMFDLHVPTTKTTSALLALTKEAAAKVETTACINCGRCVSACPEQLVPTRLATFAEHSLKEQFEKWHGMECIECGSCSFACPAHQHLAQKIKTLKKEILADRRKAAAK